MAYPPWDWTEAETINSAPAERTQDRLWLGLQRHSTRLPRLTPQLPGRYELRLPRGPVLLGEIHLGHLLLESIQAGSDWRLPVAALGWRGGRLGLHRFWRHRRQPFRSGHFVCQLPRIPSFDSGPSGPGIRLLFNWSVWRWLRSISGRGLVLQSNLLLHRAAVAVRRFHLGRVVSRWRLLRTLRSMVALLFLLLAVSRQMLDACFRSSVAWTGLLVAPHPRVVPRRGHPPRTCGAPAGEGSRGSRSAVCTLVPWGLTRPLVGPVWVSLRRTPKPEGEKQHKRLEKKDPG